MKINFESSEPDIRVELIPLIDVIFCILTFFILAAVTLTRQTAINVDLPSAATGAPQMREMLIVSVDPIGQLYIEKNPVSRDQLYQQLLQYQQTNPDGLMVLYASRLASYSDVVSVLDLLRSVGGDRVALATLPDSGQSAPPAEPTLPSSNFGQPSLTNPNSVDPINPFGSDPAFNDPFNPNQPLFPGLDNKPSSGSSRNGAGTEPLTPNRTGSSSDTN